MGGLLLCVNDRWIGVQYDHYSLGMYCFQTGEFYWDRDLRGTINSSFFWGYVLTQVVGGMLAMKFGAKWVLGGGLTISIVCTFLSPAAARISPYALMAARFLNGVGSVIY